MKLKNLFLILTSLFLVLSANAETNEDFFNVNLSGALATRAIYLGSKDETYGQSHVTIKLAVDVNGYFDVIAIGRSGETYGGNWDSYVGHDDDYHPSFDVRNFYLSKTFAEKYTVNLGDFGTDNGILRSGGFSSTGWMTGLRASADTSFGEWQVTVASLNDLEETAFYEREFDLNYYEIKVSEKVFDKLLFEVALENYDDNFYFKGGVNYDLKVSSKRVVKLILEGIVDEDGEFKSLLGAEIDPVQMATGKDSSIKLRLSWQHVSEDFDLSARPSTSFWSQPGETLMVEASGAIKEEWGLSWFAQARINEDPDKSYYLVGMKKTFSTNPKDWFKKKRKKKKKKKY